MGKSLLDTAKMLFNVLHKVVELHEIGVTRQIVDHIHRVVSEMKAVVDDHHAKHAETDVKTRKSLWSRIRGKK